MRARAGVALLGLAAASALGSVVVVEGGLRLLARRRPPALVSPMTPWLVSDTILGQANLPGFRDTTLGIAINALGLRGPETTATKPPGTIRIVCLGDSTTFGVWRNDVFELRFDVIYPVEMGALARARGLGQVEVLNAGVLGYTTAQALRLLLTRIAPLEPDVVVMRLGNNDHTLANLQPSWLSGARPYPVYRRLPAFAFDWQVVRLAIDAHQRWTAPRPTPGAYKVPMPQFERNLVRLVESVRGMGATPIFLDFPYRPLDQGEWRGEVLPNPTTEARNLIELHAIHATYQEGIRRLARELDVPFVETAAALRAHPSPTFTDFDNSHPNGEGIRLIARVLLDALASRPEIRLGPGTASDRAASLRIDGLPS